MKSQKEEKPRAVTQIRVLHIITGLDTGGAEMMLYKLLRALDRDRYATSVVSLTDMGELGAKIRNLGIPVKSLHIGERFTGLGGVRAAIAVLRELRPDVVQTWMHQADLFGTFVCKLAATEARLVWGLRCAELSPTDVPAKNRLLVKILAFLSGIPDVVVANSAAGQRAHAQAGYRPRRWELIFNGFDTDAFVPSSVVRKEMRGEFDVEDESDLIGIVGRYHPMKGHQLFLEAGRMMLEKRPRTVFLMAGQNVSVDNRELTKCIDRLGLSKSVRLIGRREDIPAVMNALDVLTCASTSEAFPNVLGEAMACGIPCVAPDVGDCKEIIGESGRILPSRNPSSLCAAWEELLSLPTERRAQIGRMARERITRKYSIEAIAGRYESLYEELAGAACR